MMDVLNALGAVVHSEFLPGPLERMAVELPGTRPGPYAVRILADDRPYVRKFMIADGAGDR